MAFHDRLFPTTISWGSSGGPGFKTELIDTQGGHVYATSRWAQPKHQFDVSWGIKSDADLMLVKTFYMARSGAANTFRFRDPIDNTTAADHVGTPTNMDVQIGVGNGTQIAFQLAKKYTEGAQVRTRNITKPVSGTLVVSKDGVSNVLWSLDATTGILTFSTAPSAGQVIRIGCQFDVEVRFSGDADEWLEMSLDQFDAGNIRLKLVEETSTAPVSEEFPFGGAKDHGGITANISVSVAEGRVHRFSADAASLVVTLPDYTSLPTGGPYFYFRNDGANTATLKDHLAVTVGSLTTAAGFVVVLGLTSGGAKKWYIM